MKSQLLKIVLFSVLYAAYPVNGNAEIQRIILGGENYNTHFQVIERKGSESIKCEKNRSNLYRLFFRKWKSKDETKGILILGVVALTFLALLFVLYGFGFIIIAAALDGGVAAVLLSLLMFGIAGFCIFGITRIARKLKRLRKGIAPTVEEDELPRRPPSRNLKH